jgi:3-methylcrotonyl-CoA carboxylase alpha subunit
VEQGDEITPYYDPMIAKLIVWDTTRELALQRMLQALAQYRIVGVANNVEFLSRLVGVPGVRARRSRHRVDRARARLPVSGKARRTGSGVPRRGARDAAARGRGARRTGVPTGDPHLAVAAADGWRLNSHSERKRLFRFGEHERTVVVGYGDGGYELRLDERHGSRARRARHERYAARGAGGPAL